MTSRHVRRAGVRIVEEALAKVAFEPIAPPSLATLKAKKTRELGQSATATVPKILSVPSVG